MITADEWAGSFGDEYAERQEIDTEGRGEFWNPLIKKYGIESVVEIGCGTGTNLAAMDLRDRVGVDVNRNALKKIPKQIGRIHAGAHYLPFSANEFDLALTFGVLIHIPPDRLEESMREIIRVSKRYVFAGEYAGDDEIPYRGGVLWRRDYGRLYQDIGLKLVDQGTLKGEPWDRGTVTWWLLDQRLH